MNKAAHTRRVYYWEENWIPAGPDCHIGVLRQLGARIWRDAGKTTQPPRIVAGDGERSGRRLMSYAQGADLIVLCRAQRNRRTLIHEITHTILADSRGADHGPAFLRLYSELLARYL